MAKRTNEERHFHCHRNQQFGSIWANEFQSQAKSGGNQNITYDCHLVVGGCQCSVLDARLGLSIGGALAAISSPASSHIPEETAFGQEERPT